MGTYVLNNQIPSFKQDEYNANEVRINVPAEMQAFDLFIVFALPSNRKVFTPKLSQVNGVVTYPLAKGITSEIGRVMVELQGYLDGKYIKSATYTFNIVKGLTTSDDPDQADYAPWYVETVKMVEEARAIKKDVEGYLVGLPVKADQSYVDTKDAELSARVDTIITTPVEGVSAQEIIDARQGKDSLGANISEVKSQLSDMAQVFVKARDFATLQEAIDYASNRLIADPNYIGTSDVSTVINLVLERKQYNIDTPIVIPFRLNVIGNGAILKAPDGGRIFYSTTAYRVRFESITFHGRDVEAVYFDVPNLDNAKYDFDHCVFSTNTMTLNKYSVYVKSRSGRLIFNECDVVASPNFLNADEIDFCTIAGGWINGWSPLSPVPNTKPANTCSIRNNARLMSLKGVVFIPELDGSGMREKVRWIDNYGQLTTDGCHFGGENGGFPIVYQYITSVNDTHPFTTYADISIRNGQSSCGGGNRFDSGIVVLMPGVIPGRFTFENLTFVIDSRLISAAGYDFNGTTDSVNELLRTNLYSQSNRTLTTQISIKSSNVNSESGVPACLRPFLNKLPSATEGAISNLTDNTPIPILDILKIFSNNGTQTQLIAADVTVQISGVTAVGNYPLTQVKKVKISAHFDSGGLPILSTENVSFNEPAPAGGAKGDTLINIASDWINRTPTNVKYLLTVAPGLNLLGTSWRIDNIQVSNNLNASGVVILARNYI